MNSKTKHLRIRYTGRIVQLLCQVPLWLGIVFMIFMVGCSNRYHDVPVYWPWGDMDDRPNKSVGRFKSFYLARQIDQYYRGVQPGPIGVTTFVNLDDLYATSSFGRIYAEQVMSELSMLGYDVVELRHSDAIQFLVNNGEYALSRDVASVRRVRDLGGVVVGTYTVSPVRVYVNARLVDPTTSMVLSAGSVEMRKTNELTRLTRGGQAAPTLERIPIQGLGLTGQGVPSYGSTLQGRQYDLEESAPFPSVDFTVPGVEHGGGGSHGGGHKSSLKYNYR